MFIRFILFDKMYQDYIKRMSQQIVNLKKPNRQAVKSKDHGMSGEWSKNLGRVGASVTPHAGSSKKKLPAAYQGLPVDGSLQSQLKLPNISKDISGRNWRRKVEKTLNAATRTRDKLFEQSENESPRGKLGDGAFLTGVDSSENPLDNFNNKSVELLCAKYQPNTSIGKDTLRKFFQSPRKSP